MNENSSSLAKENMQEANSRGLRKPKGKPEAYYDENELKIGTTISRK